MALVNKVVRTLCALEFTTKKLKRIAPLRYGITLGVVWLAFGPVIVAITYFLSLLGTGPVHRPPSIVWITVPMVGAVLAFVVGIFFSVLYNLASKLTGGVEYTVHATSKD